MLKIAEEVLPPYVRRKCIGDLKGLHEDILQDIYVNMIKYCVTGFLRKDGKEKNAEDFQAWMYAVAKNKINDFGREIQRRREAENASMLEQIIKNQPSGSDSAELQQKKINIAVGRIVKSKSEPHIVLTWLLVSILMLQQNEEKKDINYVVEKHFTHKSLDEILDYIGEASKRFWWEPVSVADIQKLRGRLDEQHTDGRRLGEVCYEEFKMKKGMLSSLSDWMNRMNDVAAVDPDEKEKKKKKKKKSDGEMEETDDGSSHD